MDSPEYVEWMAFYQVEYELLTGTMPPLEFDDPAEHSAAIDALFR
ncbi:hypothetical protein SA496_15515 [Pseudomonas sp. JS3066]|nr:hypothetical protein [Pseudomonas sp. JS3066]WVK91136.1 hypothetical protein SA496_15515 [Pseudomonas sp. JS3066]